MSLRGNELAEYLELANKCAALSLECSDIYQASCEARGKQADMLRAEFDIELGEYLKLNARRDALWAKMLKEDGPATIQAMAERTRELKQNIFNPVYKIGSCPMTGDVIYNPDDNKTYLFSGISWEAIQG